MERKCHTGRLKPYFLHSTNTNRYQESCHSVHSMNQRKAKVQTYWRSWLSSHPWWSRKTHSTLKEQEREKLLHHRRQIRLYLWTIKRSHGIIKKKIEKMFQTRHAESDWYYILKKYMSWNNEYSFLFKECIYFHCVLCFFFLIYIKRMVPCLQYTLFLLALLQCLVHPGEHNFIQRHLSKANVAIRR